MEALQITQADLLEVDRELSKRSLVEYINLAWPILEPARRFVPNWHIDAIAEHLTAITTGHIRYLLINVPPGMTKSLSVRVFWPTWEWGARNLPHYRYIGASHRQELAIRDNIKARRLVMSAWYQNLWPIKLMEDQDNKVKFENKDTGFMLAIPANSITGERGDRIAIDDPHPVEGGTSEVERRATVQWFRESVPTRLNDPDKSAIVVIMQRTHEEDVAAVAKEFGYEHLCLPMEYEIEEKKRATCIGFSDPREKLDDLLFPERFPREVVDHDKVIMGSYAVAAQFQQRPTPRGGGLVKAEMLKIVDDFTPTRMIRYWDKAGTEEGGAYTSGALVGVNDDGIYCVMDIVRGQWTALKRERIILQTAGMDGTGVSIYHEQEPGSGGKESAESTTRNLAGYAVRADKVTGEKTLRAEPFATQVEAGNVKLKRGTWNRAFIDEAKVYGSTARYKDQIDSAAGAFNKLALAKRWIPGAGVPLKKTADVEKQKPKEDVFYPISVVLH